MPDEAIDPGELAGEIRRRLASPVPSGFRFSDHAARQDFELSTLASELERRGAPEPVSQALSQALLEEPDRWISLKLIELADRLKTEGVAAALLERIERSHPADPESRFLAGRACEVLLGLTLSKEQRLAAEAACTEPLSDLAKYRALGQRVRREHAPRWLEIALLVSLMGSALTAMVFALRALR